MDTEIKQELRAINSKFDTHIKHQEKIIELRLKPIDEHIKEGPHFRDKIVKIGESLRINWIITLAILGTFGSTIGAIGAFLYFINK